MSLLFVIYHQCSTKTAQSFPNGEWKKTGIKTDRGVDDGNYFLHRILEWTLIMLFDVLSEPPWSFSYGFTSHWVYKWQFPVWAGFILYIIIQIVWYINYMLLTNNLTNICGDISKFEWFYEWLILAMWKDSTKLKRWVENEWTLHRWPRLAEMSDCSRLFQ